MENTSLINNTPGREKIKTTTPINSGRTAYIKYILSLLIFSSNGIAATFINLNSYEIVFFRTTTGCIFMFLLFSFTGHKFTATHHKKDLMFIALSGIGMAADWLFLFEAYQQIGVSLGILLNYCGPAIVVVLSKFVFGEHLTVNKITALFAALIGVFLITEQTGGSGFNLWGLSCGVLSAVSYSVMVIFNKKSKKIVGMENACLQLFFAMATVILFITIKGFIDYSAVHSISGPGNFIVSAVSNSLIQAFSFNVSVLDWFPILWLGILNTGIGCYLYFSSFEKLSAQTVAVCGYIEPLAAVLLSVILLGESLGHLQLLGAGLIIGGAILGELKKKSTVL